MNVTSFRPPPRGASRGLVEEAGFWTPFGAGTVVTDDDRLIEVRLPTLRAGAMPAIGMPSPGKDPTAPAGGAGRWAAAIEAYFGGERTTWTPEEVDLDILGVTPFRRDVYQALLSVPAGETVSYGELAVLSGRPGAARAVGTAMAENPIPVVVPCHRVVLGDGSLGRYGDDDRWKAILLQLESGR